MTDYEAIADKLLTILQAYPSFGSGTHKIKAWFFGLPNRLDVPHPFIYVDHIGGPMKDVTITDYQDLAAFNIGVVTRHSDSAKGKRSALQKLKLIKTALNGNRDLDGLVDNTSFVATIAGTAIEVKGGHTIQEEVLQIAIRKSVTYV